MGLNMGLNSVTPRCDSDLKGHQSTRETAYRTQPWYEAYMAALFESNRMEIVERIKRAELLMVHRERVLLDHREEVAERSALNMAFDALRALEYCLKMGPTQ